MDWDHPVRAILPKSEAEMITARMGNMGNDTGRLSAASAALKQAAFNIETVAHLGHLEAELLPRAVELRAFAHEMEQRVKELTKC